MKQEGDTDKQEGASVAPRLDTAAFPRRSFSEVYRACRPESPRAPYSLFG